MKTLIVNHFGGPGSGKSTLATGVFSKLKNYGYNAEYVNEHAKQLVWEGNQKTLANQIYVTAAQYHKEWMLYDQVDVVITDSPIILGLFYWKNDDKKIYKAFHDLTLSLFKQQNQFNVFIERVKPYNPKGRNETLEQAIEIDEKIKTFLNKNKIPYIIAPGRETEIDYLTNQIILATKKSCQNP